MDGFGIKSPTKVDMPLNKETKSKIKSQSGFLKNIQHI